jgi:hypothetical protein
MAKQTGLGDGLLVGGYDLSGDTGAVDNISGGPAAIEMTGIDKSGVERYGGVRDGKIEWSSFFNDATGHAHEKLRGLPTSDVVATYLRGRSLGNQAACMVAKQLNYDGNRSDSGELTFKVESLANAYGLEWTDQLTAGLRTDTGATSGTGVGFTGDNFIFLPGSSGNTVTTPDAAALDITGDIDIRIKLAAADWTPTADSYLLSKYVTTGNQRSFALVLTSTGTLAFQWSADGTTAVTKNSTANLASLAGNAVKWVRATLDVDNGAAGNDVKFYTSDDGTTWTQLGTTVTTAGTTSIFASTAVLELGSRNAGTSDFLISGKIFEAEVKNGIDGTTVAHPVATSSGITDATGLTWTLNGTAILTNWTTYGAQAYLQVTSFTGTDMTVKLQESYDNSTWVDVTGGAFTAVTSAPTTQRLAITGNLRRYLRVTTTTSSGFTSATFAVSVAKNQTAVNF